MVLFHKLLIFTFYFFMKAAIITIGDEILIGQIVDTNSSFIGKELEKVGCKIVEKRSISDNYTDIIYHLNDFQNKVDLVICTGGLGPTQDDQTKKAIKNYFNDYLIRDKKVLTHVTQLIERIYNRPVSEINKQQADVPSRAKILFNQYGTAPGLLLKKENTVFAFLPGVPFEMKHLIIDEIIPFVKSNFPANNIFHHTITTIGIGESLLAEKIKDWEDFLLKKGYSLAYLPFLGGVYLRISAYNITEKETECIKNHIYKLNDLLLPENILSINKQTTLIEEVSQLLVANKHRISIAESCTGGKLTHEFAKIPGASQYLIGGIVTYATESKINLIDVKKETIDTYSVVSKEVAKEMAMGVAKKLNTNISLSTTGNAGPSKGDSDAEVGTVCIGMIFNNKKFSYQFNFGKERKTVIELTIQKALQLLYKELKREAYFLEK